LDGASRAHYWVAIDRFTRWAAFTPYDFIL
jgi:hypothetical protein